MNFNVAEVFDRINAGWDPVQVGITAGRIALIIIGFHLLIRIFTSILERTMLVRAKHLMQEGQQKRIQSLTDLLKSSARYILDFVAVMTILPLLGVETGQFLAGAGVVGIAVGFGAQTLVRDVITGFFLLFENQFSVDDYVEVAGVRGQVEKIGLRVAKIRSFDGELHFVPNGQIKQVTNYSRGPMRVLVDVGIAYEEDVDKAIQGLEALCEELAEEIDEIVEGPQVLGVQDLGDSSVVLRVLARTVPLEKWSVERILLYRIKRCLDEEGIEIPYPRCVVVPPTHTGIRKSNGPSNEKEDQSDGSRASRNIGR